MKKEPVQTLVETTSDFMRFFLIAVYVLVFMGLGAGLFVGYYCSQSHQAKKIEVEK